MITLVVVFCLVQNSYICRTLEMAPIDHKTVSIPECIRGGAIGGMTFVLEHAEWRVKGYRCTEKLTVVQQWAKTKP